MTPEEAIALVLKELQARWDRTFRVRGGAALLREGTRDEAPPPRAEADPWRDEGGEA